MNFQNLRGRGLGCGKHQNDQIDLNISENAFHDVYILKIDDILKSERGLPLVWQISK